MPNNNPWAPWLEESPTALYQAKVPGGISPSFVDYWQRQQSRVMGQYQGALGGQVLAGQPPSLSFEDFLGEFPWSQRWYQMSPRQRGLNTGLAPSLQWNV